MPVPGDRKDGGAAVGRTRDHDGQLRPEFEFALRQERAADRPTESLPRVIEVGDRGDPKLAAAVIPADRQLEPKRQAELGCGDPRLGHGMDLAPGGDGATGALDEATFSQSVLGDEQRAVTRPHRESGLESLDDLGRDVLQLVGHDDAHVGQPKRGTHIVIGPDHDPIGDRRGWTVRVRIQDRDPVAHRPSRRTEHPPELAATQDADDGRWRDRQGSVHAPSVEGTRSDRLSNMHIVILGLMGAGKTTVGRLLAERLDWSWRDSDIDIEAATGLTVRELRERDGVVAMHRQESAQLLDALAATGSSVISAAASVVDDPACRTALKSPGAVAIWLRADPALLAERFDSRPHRPAYGDVPEVFLADQAAQREPLLAQIGAHVIDVEGLTPHEVVARAMETLG